MGEHAPGSARATPLGLVLGAGGTVGLAYHAGVLRALEQEAGVSPGSAELIVGTSAGAVAAAYVRCGWSTADLWAHARTGQGDQLAAAVSSPLDLVRRGLGSAFVMGRSLMRVPAPPVPAWLGRVFPGGMYRMDDSFGRLRRDLPAAWPSQRLWLCALDIVSGRRVVLGREGSPEVPPATAVLASCAIPVILAPVRLGHQVLVDGGMHSTTNLDLAAKAGCGLVIGVAPMTYDPASHPSQLIRVLRRVASGTLNHEAARVRSQGAVVLLIRPTAAELAVHGINPMRADGLDKVAATAYESTARALSTDPWRRALSLLAA